ncbi:MAG: ZIP family metal transporter [Endomicrobiia bacterium]|nr:ZIP family metal transporter [Endomicrobiaceae bacterium]MDD5101686.1 ZIP family metal transporter [Endomicrobiaceae bacterium]
MNNFVYSLLASIIVSFISFIGIISLLFNKKLLKKILILLVALSAGSLIGGAFLHLLPEAMEKTSDIYIPFVYVILGFTSFFILEKYLFWRHCHKSVCEVHSFTYMNLIGDGLHNFIDGLIIAVSFSSNLHLGIVTTIAIILHEIPQELGDFGVLIYGGMKPVKALFFNFLSAFAAVIGTVIGYYYVGIFSGFSFVLMSFAAGGFIYVGACDLIPELHRHSDRKNALMTMFVFLLGIGLMFILKLNHN